MKFLVFLALAVACVMAQQQQLEEQPRDKRDTIIPSEYPTLYPSLYRSVIPTTYAAHYPYTYEHVYPYSYYPTYHSLPYVYYK
ncbi:hypothetical protein GE061_017808 [Apolygus lucorum]|uniref:Uncharacterized protein n=1 Tax=Apolygus lucorum TaxID=248454 RepID=A0A8S9XDG6_APOLU|nr:hypothetical protein GE061_017808 [Apolygus lucorum]